MQVNKSAADLAAVAELTELTAIHEELVAATNSTPVGIETAPAWKGFRKLAAEIAELSSSIGFEPALAHVWDREHAFCRLDGEGEFDLLRGLALDLRHAMNPAIISHQTYTQDIFYGGVRAVFMGDVLGYCLDAPHFLPIGSIDLYGAGVVQREVVDTFYKF